MNEPPEIMKLVYAEKSFIRDSPESKPEAEPSKIIQSKQDHFMYYFLFGISLASLIIYALKK